MAEPRIYSTSLPGTMDGVIAAARWLHVVADRERLSEDVAFAVEVCLEELLTNIARHGAIAALDPDGAGDVDLQPAAVTVALSLGHVATELVIEDNGPPFDVAAAPVKRVDRPLEQVVPGGLGMQLIHNFSSDLRYERLPAGNRTTLRFAPAAADLSGARA